MASYVVGRIQDQLNRDGKALRGANIVCYGAAFKPNVSDMRNSRAVRIMELLQDAGSIVTYTDPRVPTFKLRGEWVKSIELTQAVLNDADIAILLVGHPELPADLVCEAAPLVFDAVNATRHHRSVRIERL